MKRIASFAIVIWVSVAAIAAPAVRSAQEPRDFRAAIVRLLAKFKKGLVVTPTIGAQDHAPNPPRP